MAIVKKPAATGGKNHSTKGAEKAPVAAKTAAVKKVPKSKPEVLQIDSKADYERLAAELGKLLLKGSKKLTAADQARVLHIGPAVQDYERQYYAPRLTSIGSLVEYKLYELKLTQKEMASKLAVSEAKLSLIMNNKQNPDSKFLKALHTELGIDGNVIVELL